ncbi:hypothetical protein N9444_00955 [Gammaproteobacteria bacterium]|nr:hypothetical protein [Gammaproteobacteria bacterium]
MKTLLTTNADNAIRSYSRFTLPLLHEYAKFLSAEFFVMDHEPPVITDDGKPHFRTMRIGEFLQEYDRVVYIDADCVLNKNIPNVLKLVPPEKVGCVLEDVGSQIAERSAVMKAVQREFGEIGWRNKFINNGIMVVSKEHKCVFEPVDGQYYLGWMSDIAHISYQIKNNNLDIFELNYTWNHMSMFSEPWNGSPSRFDSKIIHYAGNADFPDRGRRSRERLIADDAKQIHGLGYYLRAKLFRAGWNHN